MQEDHPYVPRDCYYFSYLEGVPGSMATLDTCNGGLRGMLQVDDLTYEIKPLEASSTFEHVVSNLVLEEASQRVERCTIEEEVCVMEEVAAINVNIFLLEVFAEIYLVFAIYQNTVTGIHLNAHLTLMSRTEHLARKVHHKVSGADRRDQLSYSIRFQGRRHVIHMKVKRTLLPRHFLVVTNNDQGAMQEDHPYVPRDCYYFSYLEGVPGSMATLDTCNGGLRGMLQVDDLTYEIKPLEASSTFEHVVSNLVLEEASQRVERCTIEEEAFHHRFTNWDTCLSDRRPSYNNMPYVAPRCGDKIVNQREECDCGSLKECAQDKCCGTNCIMTLGSLCDGGSCCHNCKYLPPGILCRDILGICDLPEYCDGHTPECPPDTYVQDGTPCSVKAVCMAGNCSDRDMQCQALFGYQTKDGSPLCYSKLNKVGDRVGNCGVQVTKGGGKPVKCEADDVFCGMLHCQGITEIFGGGEHSTFRQIIVKDIKEETCFGYDAHFGTEKPYMGLVVDGASCGPGRFCHNQTCTYFQDLNFTCNVSTCNYRGVCNNKRNCHCLRGWKPPTCLEKGGGGSIDSGPPPDKDPALRARILVNVNQWLVVLSSRAVLLLLSILIGALSQIKRMIEKKRVKQQATAQ
ncbi:disintegrin and metalloproteinase domain-containing protein 20-like [Tenrec ecaudatus]|uniref:disintegrin and metalloproteinase domain-containing protein 20-like n=1 Tax=Tenrec ecaudatus TaxID=94439 RepID=UPI003F5A07B2